MRADEEKERGFWFGQRARALFCCAHNLVPPLSPLSTVQPQGGNIQPTLINVAPLGAGVQPVGRLIAPTHKLFAPVHKAFTPVKEDTVVGPNPKIDLAQP